MIRQRIERLRRIRQNPDKLPALKNYYRDNIATFIDDWGITIDPRAQPVLRPFILFPKQRELVNWIIARWQGGEPGVVVKSRDVGASWDWGGGLVFALPVSQEFHGWNCQRQGSES